MLNGGVSFREPFARFRHGDYRVDEDSYGKDLTTRPIFVTGQF